MHTAFHIRTLLITLALVIAATAVCELLQPVLMPINLLMIYLLAVVLVALTLGLYPAVVTVTVSCVLYNYLYVPPRLALNFREKEYVADFFGLFITGVVISSLVSKINERAAALEIREAETACMYHFSQELARAADRESIIAAVRSNFEKSLSTRIAMFLPDNDTLTVVAASGGLDLCQDEIDVSFQVFHNGTAAGYGTDSHSSSRLLYVPLRTLTKSMGVVALEFAYDSTFSYSQIFRLTESFATQAAMALERVELACIAEQAHIRRSRQKLERALLNSVSHDLRSPLATITGVLSSILVQGDHLTEQVRHELLENARGEAERLNRFVGNLMEITRLESREAILKNALCDVEDLIGCSLAAIERQRTARAIEVKLAPGLPMVPMDMVLMNQVLINLIENALKYSPPDGVIGISASCTDMNLLLQVADCGAGVPQEELTKIFEKFYRIPVPESISGTGLGLSICKGIVEAHGGRIWAENMPGGGFLVSIEMPLQTATQQEGGTDA